MNKKRGVLLGLALSLLCWMTPGFAQQSAAGEVWSATGNAQVKRDGQWLRLKSGVALQPGDTIATGADGDVRFRLKDDSYYAVVPNSWFVIDEFATRKVGQQQEGGRAIFSLLRGGFRAVTGLIGKIQGDTYTVKTPVATIGVRGTEYGMYYCEDCGAVSEGSQDGLHVYTYSGTVTMENEQGSQEISEGDSGYAGTPESGQTAPPPEKTEDTEPPPVFTDTAPETYDPNGSVGPTPEQTQDTQDEQAQQEQPRVEPEPIASESAP